ncbi:hypothetical protein DFH09DRAFT_1499638 [Mycena vulgaris]|nr:hypothetical protein DFH09DRAFT_1499638 [Mycena vulgaris]
MESTYSAPLFPPELERQIFEISALSRPVAVFARRPSDREFIIKEGSGGAQFSAENFEGLHKGLPKVFKATPLIADGTRPAGTVPAVRRASGVERRDGGKCGAPQLVKRHSAGVSGCTIVDAHQLFRQRSPTTYPIYPFFPRRVDNRGIGNDPGYHYPTHATTVVAIFTPGATEDEPGIKPVHPLREIFKPVSESCCHNGFVERPMAELNHIKKKDKIHVRLRKWEWTRLNRYNG